MHLIRIGTTVVNLDRLAAADYDEAARRLTLVLDATGREVRHAEGDEAAVLWGYLQYRMADDFGGFHRDFTAQTELIAAVERALQAHDADLRQAVDGLREPLLHFKETVAPTVPSPAELAERVHQLPPEEVDNFPFDPSEAG